MQVNIERRCLSAACGLLGLLSLPVSGEQVWSEDYQEYVDADMRQYTIEAVANGEASSELLWSDDYDVFVSAGLPRHVVKAQAGCSALDFVSIDDEDDYLGGDVFEHCIADSLP